MVLLPGDLYPERWFACISHEGTMIGVITRSGFYSEGVSVSSILHQMGVMSLHQITQPEFETYLAFGIEDLEEVYHKRREEYIKKYGR